MVNYCEIERKTYRIEPANMAELVHDPPPVAFRTSSPAAAEVVTVQLPVYQDEQSA